jgi:hypothetical protein
MISEERAFAKGEQPVRALPLRDGSCNDLIDATGRDSQQ